MLQRLEIALAQLKVGTISENHILFLSRKRIHYELNYDYDFNKGII